MTGLAQIQRQNFYPRPPRGGRPGYFSGKGYIKQFLSTPSVRRATYELRTLPRWQIISIHALREEGDRF